MDWVMVPVPEELVEQVDGLLFQLRFRVDVPDFDSVAMGEHLLSLADEPRGVLVEVAAAVVADQPLADSQLAETLGMSVRELFGLLTEVNDVTVRPFTGNLVFAFRQPHPENPDESVRRLHMLDGHARMVVEQRGVLGLRRPTAPRDSGGEEK